MNNTKEKIISATLAVCIVLAALFSGYAAFHKDTVPTISQLLGGSNGGPTGEGGATRYTTIPTNSTVGCGTTSTLALATSTARQYATFVNDSTSTIYLAEGQPAVGSNGIRLNSGGGSFEMNAFNMFTGAIYCIASTSPSVMTTLSSQ